MASLSSSVTRIVSPPEPPLLPFRPLEETGEIGSPRSETGLLKTSSSSLPSGLLCWLSLRDFLLLDICEKQISTIVPARDQRSNSPKI